MIFTFFLRRKAEQNSDFNLPIYLEIHSIIVIFSNITLERKDRHIFLPQIYSNDRSFVIVQYELLEYETIREFSSTMLRYICCDKFYQIREIIYFPANLFKQKDVSFSCLFFFLFCYFPTKGSDTMICHIFSVNSQRYENVLFFFFFFQQISIKYDDFLITISQCPRSRVYLGRFSIEFTRLNLRTVLLPI